MLLILDHAMANYKLKLQYDLFAQENEKHKNINVGLLNAQFSNSVGTWKHCNSSVSDPGPLRYVFS
jgi:hypothetical protein